jgi:chemotaxis protein MotA
MKFIVGIIVIMGSVLGGYVLHHGNLKVLYQPTEYLIIGGAAIGACIISNPVSVLKGMLSSFKCVLKTGFVFTKKDYIELLLFMYDIFKFMKTKGMLEIESHIENPHDSDLFKKYPSVHHNHHATDFVCDYIRMMTMGVDNKYYLEDMMDRELEAHHVEKHTISTAMVTFGDSFPAIGIVAAVLGVIITMGSISEPPEILGGLIGAALVGTFLGILISYCFVCPMGQMMEKYFNEEHKYYETIKVGLLAHVAGNAPAVSVESARKMIPSGVMPSFKELETAMQGGAAS